MLTSKRVAAISTFFCAGLLWALEPSTPADRLERVKESLEPRAGSEEIRVEPIELLDLMYNPSARLKLLDLRDENEFNLFHIVSSRRTTLDLLSRGKIHGISPTDTVVLVSNGEGRSVQGWLLLAAIGFERVYILKGGIHGWLQEFGGKNRLKHGGPACSFDECRRYFFEAALGDKHPESDPGPRVLQGRTFTRKVKVEGTRKRTSGSCG